MRVDRNIKFEHGSYWVYVMRRPKYIYGGHFKTIEEARKSRDEIEAGTPALRPWDAAPRKSYRRTHKDLYLERLAKGLCGLCGDEPHRPGRKSCRDCIRIRSNQRRERNLQKSLSL